MSEWLDKDVALQQAWQRIMLARGALVSCTNCENWEDGSPKSSTPTPQRCNKFKALPPPDTIVCGCPHWEQLIPF